ALVAGISEYQQFSVLPYATVEAETIAELFRVVPLVNETVSTEVVKQKASQATYLHLACHGSFAWMGDPLASALYLADDEPLTLGEIMGMLDLQTTRLVVLSACET